jgi:DNA-binding MarR family transcriptional regulator
MQHLPKASAFLFCPIKNSIPHSNVKPLTYIDIHSMDNHTSVGQVLNGLRVIVQSLSSASRKAETKLGITGAQRFLLQQLAETGELSVNELARRTHTHQSTVSTVITKLEKAGLVSRTRSVADARVQLLALTAKGRSKLKDKQETVQHRLIRAIDKLSEKDRKQLSALLSEVIKGAGIEHETPSLFLERATLAKQRK